MKVLSLGGNGVKWKPKMSQAKVDRVLAMKPFAK
jgi:hypothetical protein